MKKRVLSMLLAFTLCFSTLPMTALAQETEVVAEQEEQQEEAEAVAAPETPDDESTTAEKQDAGEEIGTADPVNESVSDSDAGEQNTEADAENDAAVQTATAAIAVQTGEAHMHYLCGGGECTQAGGHTENDKVIFEPWSFSDKLPTSAGKYYLTVNVTLDGEQAWNAADGVILCLNGNSITVNPTGSSIFEDIRVDRGKTFTLCNCKSEGKITHVEKEETKNTDRGMVIIGTFNMYGGNITGNSAGSGAGVKVLSGAIFNMYGGSITNNMARDTDGAMGGGVEVSGGTFNMFDGKITGNKGENGAGVYIDNRGIFNITGGEITGNTAESGSGVYVEKDGCFTVSGSAKVSGNNDSNVYLPEGATITISEGGLADNARIGVTTEKTPTQNGYVAIATGAVNGGYKTNTFTDDNNSGYEIRQTGDLVVFANGELHEHPICGANCDHTGDEKHAVQPWRGISSLNEITADGNYYLLKPVTITSVWSCAYDVQLCLNGHTITRRGNGNVIDISSGHSLVITDCQETAGKITNASSSATAAQGVHDEGTFTLWNGIITGNTASGVSMSSDSKFIMNGGAITENTSTSYYGGGVTIWAGSEFIMNGGTISNNKVTTTSHSAGGVYVYGVVGSDASKFIMNGGTITGNTSAASGGGVVVGYNCEFIMNGGSITGNVSEDAGAGVCVNKGGSFVVSGAAQIRDNRKNGTANNVYLSENQIVTIGSAGLTTGENGAKIGITTAKELSAGSEVQVAVGASDSVDYNQIFASDVADRGYRIEQRNGNLYLSGHQHSWEYSVGASGRDILATCTNTSTCPQPHTYMTIREPEHEVYGDGKPADAKLSSSEWIADAVDVIYKKGDDILHAAPTDAGTYTANITLKSANGNKVTAFVFYKIAKATPVVKDFDFSGPENLTYDGNAKTVKVEAKPGMGDVTVKYYQGETEVQQPTNVGEYTVKINVAEGKNYEAANDLTSTDWKFKIVANTSKPTVELSGSMAYTGEKITPEVTVKIGDKTLVKDRDYTITYGTNVNVGENAGKVTITAAGNYAFENVEMLFTIEKAAQMLNFTKDTVIKTYIDQAFTNAFTHAKGDGAVTYASDNTTVATVDQNTGKVTITGVGTATITATATETSNYKEGTANYTLTVNKATPTGEPKYTLITTDGKTLANADLKLEGSTLSPADGTLQWEDETGKVLSDTTEVKVNTIYRWRFIPTDTTNYNSLTGEVELYHVDAPAISAQPESVSVINGEKAIFEVTATGTDVKYQWKIDRNDGMGFVDIIGATGARYTTRVTDKDCNGFKYQCVISNVVGSVTTDTVILTVKEKFIITAAAGEHGNISPNGDVEVVEGSNQTFVITAEEGYEIESLTVDGTAVSAVASYTFENVTVAHTIAVTFKLQYKIIDGADSSWTQNTDGVVVIRGNGEITKFRSVRVDGKTVDAVNYTVTEGSTIITLKADYLKTLSQGSHSFEIVWEDGKAATSFTIASNNSGNNNGGNSSNDDDSDDNNSNGSANNTAPTAAPAQELDKVPATGDPSGIWMTLFAIFLAGFAGMLIIKKKDRS